MANPVIDEHFEDDLQDDLLSSCNEVKASLKVDPEQFKIDFELLDDNNPQEDQQPRAAQSQRKSLKISVFEYQDKPGPARRQPDASQARRTKDLDR